MEYRRSSIGLIPTDWRCVEISSAYTICNNKRLPISRERRREMIGPYPYFGPTGVLDHIDEYRYEGEFALIGEDGDHFLKFARQPMTLIASGRFNVNNHAHVIAERNSNSVHWFQRFYEHRDITQNLTRQGAGRYKLTKAALEKLPMAIPPPDEQRAITNALDDASELVRHLERLIAKKQAIKQGMLQQQFTARVLNDERSSLGSVANFLSGGTPDRSKVEYWSGDIPWISAATLKHVEVFASDQHVSARAVRAGSRMAPLGSTLVLVRGSALHSEIRASLVTAPVCFNQDVKALVPCPGIVPKFLTYSIHANTDRLLRLVTSAGNTAGVLDTGVLKAFELWVPQRDVQEHIVSVFDAVTEELELLAAKLVKARAMKQGMMQELLTGRTRLPVTEGAA